MSMNWDPCTVCSQIRKFDIRLEVVQWRLGIKTCSSISWVFVNRPLIFTGVTAHTRIHLLQSDFSLFVWTKPTRTSLLPMDSNTYLLVSRPWERRHGQNQERKTALQQVDAHINGNPCKRKRSIPWELTVGNTQLNGIPKGCLIMFWFLTSACNLISNVSYVFTKSFSEVNVFKQYRIWTIFVDVIQKVRTWHCVLRLHRTDYPQHIGSYPLEISLE